MIFKMKQRQRRGFSGDFRVTAEDTSKPREPAVHTMANTAKSIKTNANSKYHCCREIGHIMEVCMDAKCERTSCFCKSIVIQKQKNIKTAAQIAVTSSWSGIVQPCDFVDVPVGLFKIIFFFRMRSAIN